MGSLWSDDCPCISSFLSGDDDTAGKPISWSCDDGNNTHSCLHFDDGIGKLGILAASFLLRILTVWCRSWRRYLLGLIFNTIEKYLFLLLIILDTTPLSVQLYRLLPTIVHCGPNCNFLTKPCFPISSRGPADTRMFRVFFFPDFWIVMDATIRDAFAYSKVPLSVARKAYPKIRASTEGRPIHAEQVAAKGDSFIRHHLRTLSPYQPILPFEVWLITSSFFLSFLIFLRMCVWCLGSFQKSRKETGGHC